jgi:hypothetical protein
MAAKTHKLSQPYKVGNRELTELKIQPDDGIVRTGLILQLLSDFQALFPSVYDAARIKIREDQFLTLALASFNGLSLEELKELPATEWLPAISEVAVNFLKK